MRFAPKPANRQADLATIHILHKELCLSREDSDALKLAITQVASSADMNLAQRSKYIGHLRKLKAAAGLPSPQYTAKRPSRARSEDDTADERWSKARVLWALLAKSGTVRVDTDAALMAYVKRQTHVEHWRFLNGHQINSVIESLKAWSDRIDNLNAGSKQ